MCNCCIARGIKLVVYSNCNSFQRLSVPLGVRPANFCRLHIIICRTWSFIAAGGIHYPARYIQCYKIGSGYRSDDMTVPPILTYDSSCYFSSDEGPISAAICYFPHGIKQCLYTIVRRAIDEFTFLPAVPRLLTVHIAGI